MTDNLKPEGAIGRRGVFRLFRECVTLAFIAAALLAALFYSEEISHSTLSGLSICVRVIIPSVFPFIILSDLLSYALDFSSLNITASLFERIFKIRRAGISAFILGAVCGFPLGVKEASELYRTGQISRDECERLIGFSNNTGPAFLVSGIGAGLRGSVIDGIIIYFSMIFSAIIVGILFSIGAKLPDVCPAPSEVRQRKFSITETVKSAGLSTLYISSFLTIFASACGALRNLLGQSYLYFSILPFLEVGSAASILSKTTRLTSAASLALTSFAVGFSGLSVHLQAMSFLDGTDVKTGRYFAMKLTQGAICALVSVGLFFIFN